MYLQNFGLSRVPFSLESDPDFFWPGGGPAAALSALQRAFAQKHAFSLLTGGPGSGKTLLLNRFRDTLPPGVDVVAIPNPALDIQDLYQIIFSELGMGLPPKETDHARGIFLSRICKGNADNCRTILLVDEAQRLPIKLLHELAGLAGKASGGSPLHTVLAGQINFQDLFSDPNLTWFLKKLGALHHLAPLTETEVAAYIRHRLRVAGATADLFATDALRAVSRFSGGVPRVINLLCDHALLNGYIAGDHEIAADIVALCAEELDLAHRAPMGPGKLAPKGRPHGMLLRTRTWPRRVGWIGAACIGAAGVWIGLQQSRLPLPATSLPIIERSVLPSGTAPETGPPPAGTLEAAQSSDDSDAGSNIATASPQAAEEAVAALEATPSSDAADPGSETASASPEMAEEAMVAFEADPSSDAADPGSETASASPEMAEKAMVASEAGPSSDAADVGSNIATASPQAAEEAVAALEATPSSDAADPGSETASASPEMVEKTMVAFEADPSSDAAHSGSETASADTASVSPGAAEKRVVASETVLPDAADPALDTAAASREDREGPLIAVEASPSSNMMDLASGKVSPSSDLAEETIVAPKAAASLASVNSDIASASPEKVKDSAIAMKTIPLDTIASPAEASSHTGETLTPLSQLNEEAGKSIAVAETEAGSPNAAEVYAADSAVTLLSTPSVDSVTEVTFRISFRPGSAEIDPGSYHGLRQMADYLKSRPGMNLFIEAHPEANSRYASNLYNFRVSALKSFLAGSSIKAAILPVPEPDAGVSPMGVRAEIQDAG